MDYLVTILGILGVMDFLDLGLETLTYLETLVTSIVILSGVLGVYPKTLGWFSLSYSDYMLCLWLRIHLYIIVTLPNFCEDLIHLKLGIPQRFSIFFLHGFNPKNENSTLTSLCQVLTSCWLDHSFPYLLLCVLRIVPSSPPIFFNFKNLIPPFQSSSYF